MTNCRAEIQLAELSAFVHGILAGLHLLGIVYNVRCHNHWDVLAHAAATAYDIHAMAGHIHDIHTLQEIQR